jgi:hypothetical protein
MGHVAGVRFLAASIFLHLPDILHGIMACIVAGVGCMAASLRRIAAQNFRSTPWRAFASAQNLHCARGWPFAAAKICF